MGINKHEQHGQSRTKLYKTWVNMKTRCNNKKDAHYLKWGGRGICVCEEWADYKAFHVWAMGSGYADGLTIDRIDNDGNYTPNNCRWTTHKIQSNNTRRTVRVTLDGKSDSLMGWCDNLGIDKSTIRNRLYRGWDHERMLTQPKRPYNKKAG